MNLLETGFSDYRTGCLFVSSDFSTLTLMSEKDPPTAGIYLVLCQSPHLMAFIPISTMNQKASSCI